MKNNAITLQVSLRRIAQFEKEFHQTPADFLEKTKFIGGTEGGERDSTDYKKTLSERKRDFKSY